MADKTVVVTGANGFIASWIVKQLLERGYKRSPKDVNKVGHLLDLPGANGRLTLYKAELLGEGAYDEVVNGAHYVVHTATGVALDSSDPYRELIDPAVKGTLSVLRSAAKSKTVKRVVYTSSTTAVYYNHRFINRTEDDIVDESWWSDPDFCLKEKLYYHAGKTLAERAAYEFAKDAPFDLVTILPCVVIGALLQKNVNWSSNEIARIMKGIDKPEGRLALIQSNLSFVDVEDVAMAHIIVMENPHAEGRYLTVGQSLNNDQLAVHLAKLYPECKTVLKPPMEGKDEESFMKPPFKFSNEKIRNLGLNFTPIPESGKKAVKSLQKLNAL